MTTLMILGDAVENKAAAQQGAHLAATLTQRSTCVIALGDKYGVAFLTDVCDAGLAWRIVEHIAPSYLDTLHRE